MGLTHAQTKVWTVDEFRRLFEQGILPEATRVELIEGEIVEMSPQNPPHAMAVAKSNEVFVLAFHDTHLTTCQLNVEVSNVSAPEPDLSVIPKDKVVKGQHFKASDLVMEVSDTSLSYDRHEKSGMYAKWRLQEYWILNLRDRQLEVHREPHPKPGAPFGHAWGSVEIIPETGTVTPLCRPDVILQVADLL